jgi:hypothetical protein
MERYRQSSWEIAYRRRRVGNSEEEAGSVGHVLAADGTARDCRFWGGRAGGDMSGTDESEYRKAPCNHREGPVLGVMRWVAWSGKLARADLSVTEASAQGRSESVQRAVGESAASESNVAPPCNHVAFEHSPPGRLAILAA